MEDSKIEATIDSETNEIEEIAEKKGWKGIYLPNWAYDILVGVGVLIIPIGTFVVSIIAATALTLEQSIPLVCGAGYMLAKELAQFFNINYNKANKK